jgi:hypothetical protein
MSHYLIVISARLPGVNPPVTSTARRRWIDQVSVARPAVAGGLRADQTAEAHRRLGLLWAGVH